MHIYNFLDNDDAKTIAEKGPFKVIEWQRDLSVPYLGAQAAYFAAKMDVRRRQLVAQLDGRTGVTLQAGAMQWTAGSIQATTGVKGVGDFFGKALRGSVTGESAIKPEYMGEGTIVCEPTYRHILLMSPQTEMGGTMVVNDGLFMACTLDIRHRAIMVKRPSPWLRATRACSTSAWMERASWRSSPRSPRASSLPWTSRATSSRWTATSPSPGPRT